jgi:signal transduction histidine kinase
VRLVAYVPVATALFAGALVIANLVDALRESEVLNRELDERVSEKHAELAGSYERMRGLEREQATAVERERIMREMHDGVGGLLVSTLAMVEAGEGDRDRLGGALREALDEMRLMLDSLDPAEDDLLAVLATMRARLQPRLAVHGIEFDWQVAATQPLPGLTPTVVLHVLRIVQEAISNTIRHADARTITVRSGESSRAGREGVFLEVADDGCGLRDEVAPGSHRGLANMRRRAQEIGAELEVQGSPGGTCVRLWLALEPDAARVPRAKPR